MSALALVGCLGWSAAARADEPAALFEDGADLRAQARTLYAEGTAAANLHQWERARLFYLSAWRAQHQWQIAANLGHVELALARHRDAAEHLTIFLRETGDLTSIDARDRATLARELEQARGKVAVVTVGVEPAGAEVLVDGAPVGKAPLADPVFVEPGHHVIEARADGRRSVVASRDLGPGGAVQVMLRLEPAPNAGVGLPPLAPVASREAPVRGGASKAILISGAAVGGAGVLVGVVLSIVSAQKGSAADVQLTTLQQTGLRAPCPTHMAVCSSIDTQRRAHDLLAKGATGAFVVGGATGLTTLGYGLLAPKRTTKTGTMLVPVAGLDRAELMLVGAW